MCAPFGKSFVDGLFQRFVAAFYRYYLRSEHFHFLYVEHLSGYVGSTHVYGAFHVHQGADGGSGHSVLSGSGFGYDAFFAHAPRQKYLAYGVVYLVCAGVVEVFPFEIKAYAVFFGKFFREIQRRRPADVVLQQQVEFLPETFGVYFFEVGGLKRFDVSPQHFRYVGSAERAVVSVFVYIESHVCICVCCFDVPCVRSDNVF